MYRPARSFALVVLGASLAAQSLDPAADLPSAASNPALAELEIEVPPPPAPAPGIDPERFVDLFMPWRTETAALSPDGRHLAFSSRQEDAVRVVIVNLDAPTEPLANLLVATDEASTPPLMIQADERVPARIDWMGWVTPERLVIQTNHVFATSIDAEWVSSTGAIYGVDFNGGQGELLVTPMDLGRVDDGFESEAERSSFAPLPGDAATFLENPVLEAPDAFAEEPEFSEPELPEFSELVPRSPQFADYSPDNPEEIWIRGGAPEDFDLWALNAVSGRLRLLATERVEADQEALLDRRQKAAIAVSNHARRDFPHRYRYDRPGTFFRWQPIDEFVPAEIAGFHLEPSNTLGGRSIPLGFDEDPDLLYFASDMGRERFGVYGLRLSTGQRTDLAIEHPVFDLIPPLLHGFDARQNVVFDRYSRRFLGLRYEGSRRTTAWLDESWRALQARLEATFEGQSVEILEWDRAREHFLLEVFSPTDPGALHVFALPQNRSLEIARRAPALDEAIEVTPIHFQVPAEDGFLLHGRMLLPREPIAQPVPLVVLCPTTPWARIRPGFDREALALARMGYVVVQFNGRGAWGFGRAQREAVRPGYEVASARDIVSLLDYLVAHFAVDAEKAAIVGQGLGGYLALRTLQLHGERFRCGVSIDAPMNLVQWIERMRWSNSIQQRNAADLELILPFLGDEEHLRHTPLVTDPDSLLKPVQMFAFRHSDGTDQSPDYTDVLRIARSIRRRGTPVEIHDLTRDYLRRLPHAQAEVFARVESFLHDHLFTYSVEIGELEIIEESSTAPAPTIP